MYVPANYYPVLTIVQLGSGTPSTIIGGVEELLTARQYPLAALVFFASILVPMLKLVGLSVFQTSVYLLYIEPGKIVGGTAPIIDPAFKLYSNPLPHVLILTAIVVGVATLALGLALVVRIHEAYGTIEEDEIFSREGEE